MDDLCELSNGASRFRLILFGIFRCIEFCLVKRMMIVLDKMKQEENGEAWSRFVSRRKSETQQNIKVHAVWYAKQASAKLRDAEIDNCPEKADANWYRKNRVAY